MRFEVTKVLDSIERRLSTDVTVARAVVDLASVARNTALDGGRAISVLRLGLVIDALGTHLSDSGADVFVVVDRGLMSDLELTSNEKMVLRRWADDGLVEALPEVEDRVPEVAGHTGLPIISRDDYARFAGVQPWLAARPDRLLSPVPGVNGAALMSKPAPPGTPPPVDPAVAAVVGRLWHCSAGMGCLFGTPGTGQPPPRIRGGRALCPVHGTPLSDAGPRQASVPMAVLIGGAERGRFGVGADRPTTVGRSPDGPDGIRLGELLDEDALQWVSRSHIQLEMRGNAVQVTDGSTNGTTVLVGGPHGEAVRLHRGEQRVLGDDDVVQLYRGVEVVRADRRREQPDEAVPVMAEAPTIAIKRNPDEGAR